MTPSTSPSEITPIPLLDLKAQYATIKDEVNAAVMRVIESQHFILGPEVEALEREIAEYSQCKYGIGVSSGTDALLVALMAIDIKPGDEVKLAKTFTADDDEIDGRTLQGRYGNGDQALQHQT